MKKPIRVLIAEDSKFMRQVLADMLSTDTDIMVVGIAKDGVEAIEMCRRLNPDVITMDIEMPRMDGLSALHKIMEKCPTPVIMLSAMDKKNADVAINSIEAGACDFISKPSGTVSLDIRNVKDELISKIKAVAGIDLSRLKPISLKPSDRKKFVIAPGGRAKGVIVIGASTGGPQAIEKVLPGIPGNINAAVLIVQHMPEGFTSFFAKRLDVISDIEVKEAKDNDEIQSGKAYLAPGGLHMIVKRDEKKGAVLTLSSSEKVHNVRPSVDVLMSTAAEVYGRNTVGILLSGMGEDGASGMKKIKDVGGKTIVQSEESCIMPSMPKSAIETGAVDLVLHLDQIAGELRRILGVT